MLPWGGDTVRSAQLDMRAMENPLLDMLLDICMKAGRSTL